MAWKRCGDSPFYQKSGVPGLQKSFIDPINMILVSSASRGGAATVTWQMLADLEPEAVLDLLEEQQGVVMAWALRVISESRDPRPGGREELLQDLNVDRASRDRLLDILYDFLRQHPEAMRRRDVKVAETEIAIDRILRRFGVPAC